MQRNYLRKLGFFLCGLLIEWAAYAQYTVTGGQGTPLLAADDSQNDIKVYVVYGMDNVTLSYSSSSTAHTWYRYTKSKLDAVKIESRQDGTTSIVTQVEPGYGYFVEEPDGGLPKYIWIVDYSRYLFQIDQLRVLENGDACSGVQFEGKGNMPTIYYYLPNNGFRSTLQREFEISFQSLDSWSDKTSNFPPVTKTITKKIVATDVEGTTFRFSISEPPYVDTDFTLTGDQFARHFDKANTLSTDSYEAVAVQLHVDTLLTMTDADNINTSKEGLNAPATILFTAHANDPVASRYLWRIYKIKDLAEEPAPSPDGENPATKTVRSLRADEATGDSGEETGTLLMNFSGEEVEYTFREHGVYKAVAEVSDRSGTCVATEELDIVVASSFLDVPNVLTPGVTPGMNDEFRVAYKSLVSFKAWIYNRWGKELYHWTDPAQGWDGMVKGKYVAPGAYYYVIEAVGSDGKRYKKAGDVNIIRSKQIQTDVIGDTTE